MTDERPLAEMMSLTDWRRFVPESIALLAVIVALQYAMSGTPSVPGSMPHPFWLPVLLMSCQYGVMGGLFATLASTAAFFIWGIAPQSASQDFYDYASVVAGHPCAWFGTALILGGLRTLHIHHQTERQEQLDQIRTAAEGLANGLERAVGEIERLERRIAIDSVTLASFTHSLATLDLSDRPSLVTGIADIIHHGVGATGFTLYLQGSHGLEPVLGVENGSRLALAGIPCRPPVPAEALPTALPANEDPRIPLCAPIRLAGDAEPAGVVVCHRLQPSQDHAIAARRLGDVCDVLAVLLSACPDAVSEVGRGATRKASECRPSSTSSDAPPSGGYTPAQHAVP